MGCISPGTLNFQQKLDLICNVLDSPHLLINDEFQVSRKWGFKWILLSLLKPFYKIFGKDSFRHYRVYNVAHKILHLFSQEKKNLVQTDLEKVKDITNRLDLITKGRYHSKLEKIKNQFEHLLYPIQKWKWPQDLSTLKISEEEKRQIEEILRHVIPEAIKAKTIPKQIHKWDSLQLKHKKIISPIGIAFLNDVQSAFTGVVLLLNSSRGQVLGQGIQRKPKTCFHLTSGTPLAKILVVRNEFTMLPFLQSNLSKGLPEIFGIRQVRDKKSSKREEKIQYFEELFEGNLADWIRDSKLTDHLKKRQVIQHLLLGLKFLHQAIITQEIPDYREASGKKKYVHSVFHGDLKPQNIGLNAFNAALIDFGLANTIELLAGSFAYQHPALIKVYFESCEIFPPNFTAKYGPKFDMWSLGLLMVIILKNHFSSVEHLKLSEIPPLKFIEKRIQLGNQFPHLELIHLIQEEVNKELNILKREDALLKDQEILVPLWDLAAKMLQVDPSKCISADAALLELKQIPFYTK